MLIFSRYLIWFVIVLTLGYAGEGPDPTKPAIHPKLCLQQQADKEKKRINPKITVEELAYKHLIKNHGSKYWTGIIPPKKIDNSQALTAIRIIIKFQEKSQKIMRAIDLKSFTKEKIKKTDSIFFLSLANYSNYYIIFSRGAKKSLKYKKIINRYRRLFNFSGYMACDYIKATIMGVYYGSCITDFLTKEATYNQASKWFKKSIEIPNFATTAAEKISIFKQIIKYLQYYAVTVSDYGLFDHAFKWFKQQHGDTNLSLISLKELSDRIDNRNKVNKITQLILPFDLPFELLKFIFQFLPGNEFIANVRSICSYTNHISFLSCIQTLCLRGKNPTDARLSCLSYLTALRKLDLSLNPIKTSTLFCLSKFTLLEKLDLSDTKFSDAGIYILSPLPFFRELNLDSTKITDAGIDYLSCLPHLRKLRLGSTKITDIGIAHLSHLTALQKLSLASTKITDVGLATLSILTLQKLNLNSTKITGTGLVILSQFTNLQKLSLYETKVTANSVAQLKRFLPSLTVSLR